MQQATATIVNDIGLLKAEHIPQFRSFLESKGVQVRDAGAGQFCHVRMPNLPRWMPIERGRGGAPVTPVVLRTLVEEFLVRTGLSRELKQVLSIAEAPARAAIAALAPTLQAQELQSPAAPEMPLTQVSSFQGSSDIKTPAPLNRYLSDLRDDLALNAPISLSKNATEDDLRNHAINRWAYADMMLATRTTQDGD